MIDGTINGKAIFQARFSLLDLRKVSNTMPTMIPTANINTDNKSTPPRRRIRVAYAQILPHRQITGAETNPPMRGYGANRTLSDGERRMV